MTMSLFSIVYLLIPFCISANINLPSGYSVQKEIKLSDGVIQLLMDKRVNQKTDYEAIPENAKNALVRILSADGIETSKKQLGVPRGDIELLKGNLEGKNYLFITEDKSIGFGSYNGPISILYSLDENRLMPGSAVSETTKKRGPMELMRSAKTDWKVKEKGLNGFPEIFKVSCRPDFSKVEKEVAFKVNYTHFLFDGTHWRRKDREVGGCWESENAFPAEKLFPLFD